MWEGLTSCGEGLRLCGRNSGVGGANAGWEELRCGRGLRACGEGLRLGGRRGSWGRGAADEKSGLVVQASSGDECRRTSERAHDSPSLCVYWLGWGLIRARGVDPRDSDGGNGARRTRDKHGERGAFRG